MFGWSLIRTEKLNAQRGRIDYLENFTSEIRDRAYTSAYDKALTIFAEKLVEDVHRLCAEIKEMTITEWNSQVIHEPELGCRVTFAGIQNAEPIYFNDISLQRKGFRIDVMPKEQFVRTMRGSIR